MNSLLLFPDVLGQAFSSGETPSAFVVIIVMKATVILAIGTIAAIVARRAGAAVRHAIVALTLAAALGLPLGMIAAPAWRVRILPPPVARENA